MTEKKFKNSLKTLSDDQLEKYDHKLHIEIADYYEDRIMNPQQAGELMWEREEIRKELDNRWREKCLDKLEEGVAAWNVWRSAKPGKYPNLSGADLSGRDLSGINLSGADLSGANLRGANLRGANLRGADISEADMSGADITGVNGLIDIQRRYVKVRGAVEYPVLGKVKEIKNAIESAIKNFHPLEQQGRRGQRYKDLDPGPRIGPTSRL